MIAALFSVLLLATETPATTTETASTPEEAAATATEPTKAAVKEKKICRTDPANTGTRIAKKLCLTKNEWEMNARGKNVGELKTTGGR
jgi:hypothetical protein